MKARKLKCMCSHVHEHRWNWRGFLTLGEGHWVAQNKPGHEKYLLGLERNYTKKHQGAPSGFWNFYGVMWDLLVWIIGAWEEILKSCIGMFFCPHQDLYYEVQLILSCCLYFICNPTKQNQYISISFRRAVALVLPLMQPGAIPVCFNAQMFCQNGFFHRETFSYILVHK